MTIPQNKALTRNQSLVLTALAGAKAPMSAYDILDELRPSGIRSPLQVYRALGPLTDRDLVHRLESLNAFVACAHSHDGSHHESGPVAFAICGACGQVDEFSDEAVSQRLEGWAKANSFKLAKTTVEMRGTCARCIAAA